MMETETILRIQAFLDDELPQRERAEVEQLLQSDAEARQLYAELKALKQAVVGQETLRPVPASREFYWSGIAREIQPKGVPSAEASEHSVMSWLTGWIPRILVPAGALALLTLLLIQVFDPGDDSSLHLATGHEVEIPLEETSSFTFRSESELMTVVWVDTGSFASFNPDQ